MDKSIRQRDALDAVIKYCTMYDLRELLSDIEALPPAEPERKKGKWYKPTGMMPPEYVGVYRCSECDGLAMRDWKTHKQKLTDFCPNCGADMRGDGNE